MKSNERRENKNVKAKQHIKMDMDLANYGVRANMDLHHNTKLNLKRIFSSEIT